MCLQFLFLLPWNPDSIKLSQGFPSFQALETTVRHSAPTNFTLVKLQMLKTYGSLDIFIWILPPFTLQMFLHMPTRICVNPEELNEASS